MNWILFGFKGSGKTYFGKRLGLPFLDTDALIEERENLSIREIVQKKGEGFFRKLEKQVVTSLSVENHIIAVGGGTVLEKENLFHLQSLGQMIYLKCPKELLKKRLLKPPIPTFLDPKNPEDSFEKIYCTRIKKYETIPSFTIDLKGKKETEVLENLWQVINSAPFLKSPHGGNLMAKP